MGRLATVAAVGAALLVAGMEYGVVCAIAKEGRDGPYGHSPAVLETLEGQCAEGIGDEAFCSCAAEAISTHVPPEHITIHAVSSGEEVVRTIELSSDAPEYVEDRIDAALLHCRDTYFDIDDHDAEPVGYEHSEQTIRVLKEMCREGIGNRRFCRCAIEVVEANLPPDHVSTIVYPSGHQEFFVLDTLPGHIEDILEEEFLVCRDRHVDLSGYGG